MTPDTIELPPCSIGITFWVIYWSPSDAPGWYVLRPQWPMKRLPENASEYGFVNPANGRAPILASKYSWRAKTPAELRALMPPGCINMTGQGEDPAIFETWME